MKRYILYTMILVWGLLVSACSDDESYTTSRGDLLTFTADTLKMDTVFANVGSATYTFWVYNHTDKGIRLNSVRLKNGNQTGFRVNVDGSYLDNTLGAVVTDLEVRKGDSLRVFVELTSPETHQLEPQMVIDDLLFMLESGVEQRVRLEAWAWDAEKWTDKVISRDTTIDTRVPIILYGNGLRIDSGAVLTLRGATLYFHDRAGIDVYGRLLTEGCVMRGDRLDHMFDYLPYDRVSGQWRGLWFAPSSTGNALKDTEIRNAMTAVALADSAVMDTTQLRLQMSHCIVHNAKGHGIVSYHSNVALDYCQLTNTLGDCLAVYGGRCVVDHCTLAQFYPFSADRGAALRFVADSDLSFLCTNSVVTGYAEDVVMGEHSDTTATMDYRFENCLLRTPRVENDTLSFRNITWETPKDSLQGKQHFVTIDEDNLYYDFHLDSLSTAQGKGCY
jgi:hypothetical protein